MYASEGGDVESEDELNAGADCLGYDGFVLVGGAEGADGGEGGGASGGDGGVAENEG